MADPRGKTSFVTKGLELAFPVRRRVRTPSQVTALDLDGSTLRLVHAVPRGNRIEVSRIEAVRLEIPVDADRSDAALMGKAVARSLELLGLNPSSVVMGIPRAQVILRTLQLPVIKDLRELASVVHIQVGRELPFRMEDAVIDFKVRREIGTALIQSEGALAGTGGGLNSETVSARKLE
ncbi:MAG: pilus assembly protein PilM, partial [Verrucomicrobiales bacterium]